MKPYVSIVIPTRNVGDRFDIVLKAIFGNKVDFDFEVIVVDSGSTDNTKEIISKYPVRLIEIPAHSFSHGGSRNLGAQNAKGDIIVFLTGDAVPKDEHWLLNLVKNFTDENIAGVYSRQVPEKNSSCFERFFLHHVYPDHKIIKDSINPEDCIVKDILFSDVSSAMRKAEWEKNKFKEDLIMSEDSAWSRGMLLEGKKIIYTPVSVVYHSHNYSPIGIFKRSFDDGLSLKGLIKAPLTRSISYAMDYLKNEFVFFLKNKYYRYVIIFPFYEAFRFFGFFIGHHSRSFPKFLSKALSRNKLYWKD